MTAVEQTLPIIISHLTTWWRILQNSVFSKSKCSFAIAKGIEAADAVTKAAEVGLFFAKAGCPGKYYLLFSGEVAAVQASLDAGAPSAGVMWWTVRDPQGPPQVVRAIGMTNLPEEAGAVGVMEFYSVTASIYGADAAVQGGGRVPSGRAAGHLASAESPSSSWWAMWLP